MTWLSAFCHTVPQVNIIIKYVLLDMEEKSRWYARRLWFMETLQIEMTKLSSSNDKRTPIQGRIIRHKTNVPIKRKNKM